MQDWIKWIQSFQEISQNGLAYTKDSFDKIRFEQIQTLTIEILASLGNIPMERARSLILDEVGYRTPKVDVRAAIFDRQKILMVRERSDSLWTLPGGWADPNESPCEAVVREVVEETGLVVKVSKLAMIHDSNRHQPQFYHCYKLFFICEIIGGQQTLSNETSAIEFFHPVDLRELSTKRTTLDQIQKVFVHWMHPDLPTEVD